MVTRFTVVPDEVDAQQWLYAAAEDVPGCRGQGHAFPKIKRTRTGIIKGIRVIPVATEGRSGVSRIFATCPDCGTVRIEDTLPGDLLPAPHRYTYVYPFIGAGDPRNYKPPKGVKVPRRMSFDETWRRVNEAGGLAVAESA
jgi:hypothetical protein